MTSLPQTNPAEPADPTNFWKIQRVHATASLLALTAAVAPLFAQEEANQRPGEASSAMVRIAAEADKLLDVIPTPQETYWGKGTVQIGHAGAPASSVKCIKLPIQRAALTGVSVLSA